MVDLAGASALLVVLTVVELGECVHECRIVGWKEDAEFGGDDLEGVQTTWANSGPGAVSCRLDRT